MALSGAPADPDGADAQMRLPRALLTLPYREMREQVLQAAERDYIKALLERHDRNISDDGNRLTHTSLYRLVAKHGL